MCFCTDDRCPLQGALDQHVIVIVNTKCSSEGGDNWAKKHEKVHKLPLYVQFLPQTEKAQPVTTQTPKYRYRAVI